MLGREKTNDKKKKIPLLEATTQEISTKVDDKVPEKLSESIIRFGVNFSSCIKENYANTKNCWKLCKYEKLLESIIRFSVNWFKLQN